MSSTTFRSTVVALVLVSAPLAGCLGAGGDPEPTQGADAAEADPLYGSLDEALAAPGFTFAPAEDLPVELKLLAPADTGDVATGVQNVTLALYEPGDEAPIEDANVTLDTRMPAMGHGTQPEEDPAHDAHGVYQGLTNLNMDGTWVLDLSAALPGGETATWSIELLVGDAEGEHPLSETVHHRFDATFEDTAEGLDHASNWTFPVNASGAGVHVNASLAEPSPADELELVVLDDDGDSMGSATLTAEAPNASLSSGSVPAGGTYTVGVEGRGLDTAYTIDVAVVWTTQEVPDAG